MKRGEVVDPVSTLWGSLGLAGEPYHAYPFRWVREALPWLIERQGWRGRLIVMPAFICPVLVEAVMRGGAVPALMDVDPRTWLLNVESAALPWDRVAAVMGVHTLGHPDDIGALRARVNRLAPHACVIEDAAHALFAHRDGAPLAWSGDVVFMSLYKQLGYPYGALMWSRHALDAPGRRAGGDSDPALEAWMTGDLPHRIRVLNEEVAARAALVGPWIATWPHGPWAALQQPLGPSWRPAWPLLSFELTPGPAGSRNQAVRSFRGQGLMADRLWWDAPALSPRYRPYLTGACPVSRRLAQRVVNIHWGARAMPAVLARLDHALKTIGERSPEV